MSFNYVGHPESGGGIWQRVGQVDHLFCNGTSKLAHFQRCFSRDMRDLRAKSLVVLMKIVIHKVESRILIVMLGEGQVMVVVQVLQAQFNGLLLHWIAFYVELWALQERFPQRRQSDASSISQSIDMSQYYASRDGLEAGAYGTVATYMVLSLLEKCELHENFIGKFKRNFSYPKNLMVKLVGKQCKITQIKVLEK